MISSARHVLGRDSLARCQQAISRHASTLVVAEHDNATLSPSSLSAVTAAGELKGDITLLVLGHGAQAVVEQVRVMQSLLHCADSPLATASCGLVSKKQPVQANVKFTSRRLPYKFNFHVVSAVSSCHHSQHKHTTVVFLVL